MTKSRQLWISYLCFMGAYFATASVCWAFYVGLALPKLLGYWFILPIIMAVIISVYAGCFATDQYKARTEDKISSSE